MDWQSVREQYPHRWMVMEAPDAYIDVEGEQLIVNELEVIKDFGDAGSDALKYTSKLLHEHKKRHFVMYHTANPTIYIRFIRGVGLRIKVDDDDSLIL